MTGRTADDSELSLARMSLELALLVVLPMAVAQVIRLDRRIALAATARQDLLGAVAQCGILSTVLFGAISTGLRLRESPMELTFAWDLVSMLAAVLAVHVGMFWVGVSLGKLLGHSREDQIAVGFSGSQKTLMVGLLMAVSLGITILPMVTYHITQLVVDTVIADRYRRRTAGAGMPHR
jgi:sodium/bile acid cotransporter 7